MMQRCEERQALHVVPVQMGEKHRRTYRRARTTERLAVRREPCTEVEDDRMLALDLETHARRVTAVPLVLRAFARRRSPHAPEGHVDPPGTGHRPNATDRSASRKSDP